MKKYKFLHQRSYLFIIVFGFICVLFAGHNALLPNTTNIIGGSTSFASQERTKLEQGVQTSSPSAQSPKIIVKPQPNTPLRISSFTIDSTTYRMPALEVILVNAGTQPIRAYAIRYDTVSGRSKAGGLDLSNTVLPNSILMPGQERSITIGGDTEYSDPIRTIFLSIDFVEFTDGTTWGSDTYKSAERLAGMRAGADVARRRLRSILKNDGPIAVLNSIEAGTINVEPDSNRAPEWKAGFRGGLSAVCERIKHAYAEDKMVDFEAELLRPFDNSERR